MDRRKFLSTTLAAGTIAALKPVSSFAAETEKEQPKTTDMQFLAGPYLQAPTETSMTIMWITDKKSTAEVHWGEDESLGKKAISITDGQIDANERIHKVTVTGLEPGKKYFYKVSSREITNYGPYRVDFAGTRESGIHSFTTLDTNKESFTFIVLNDIHSLADAMKKRLELLDDIDCDLVMLNGDIIQDPKSEQQIIDYTLKTLTDAFAKEIPFVFIRGNHEARGVYSRLLEKYIATPNDKYYFTFEHGPAQFLVLDGGEDKEDSHWAYSGLNAFDQYRVQQAHWLEQKIELGEFKNAPYRICLTHIPLFGSGDAHGTLDCRDKWADLLQQANIDLHISGHTHRPNILAPSEEHNYPIFIGGAPQYGRGTIVQVDVTKDKMQVKMIEDNGEVFGTYQIKPDRKPFLGIF
ncbi:Calcineurin-like phosphoesterase [Anaerohalosphaera lusitana]|uniref:Calcineurin-like phosphoesterase n=1 Tax=Anaerohalosphaera lusitana TaxID=1936003 RepID=A0A1U9NQS3_9BACT|nr:FN3 domain-containing metallophosphoesterase family protein [Anaerohalosphaera lusitana]AQT70282.1 Calcineurin-like phosphoesterase [Anaerohalosphaera lusitana]